ncbi:polysaccharide deacetylase family protein [Cohnella zeiphila]|uniref:Polysaccharide deacetylase family protein n=1 Tax=Cohnella zeiphila TaxID=2761120 RepID=A0A7X0VZ52_9BACL|nr:polysaccharide deacetylase family protein [Cohnella zeiphila]MBB6735370.1 polysaccharide deacetylase family protein [Cohnella zeiphila]
MKIRKSLAYALCGGLLLAACLMLHGIWGWAVRPANAGAAHHVWTRLQPAAYRSKKYYSGKVIVLMYHDVSPKPLNDKTLTVDRFETQLKMMKDAGFHWITMDQYLDFMTKGKPVPDNAVLLTFDDGYESLYRYAYPLLKKYHAPAVSFLIVETVGNPAVKGIPKVTWDQVKEMQANGLAFYSHSYYSHIEMPVSASGKRVRGILAAPVYGPKNGVKRTETRQEYLARITTDLDKADRKLQQELGNSREALAFPYGDYSPDLLKVCRQLGIDVTFTVKRGINGPRDWNGYRVNAGGMADDPAALLSDMEKAIPPAKSQRTQAAA